MVFRVSNFHKGFVMMPNNFREMKYATKICENLVLIVNNDSLYGAAYIKSYGVGYII